MHEGEGGYGPITIALHPPCAAAAAGDGDGGRGASRITGAAGRILDGRYHLFAWSAPRRALRPPPAWVGRGGIGRRVEGSCGEGDGGWGMGGWGASHASIPLPVARRAGGGGGGCRCEPLAAESRQFGWPESNACATVRARPLPPRCC